MNNSLKPALLLLSLLGLAACGGGGGSENSSPTPAPAVLDTDKDGTPNTTDTDDDNDGVLDGDDAFPLDAKEWADMDGDGVGDNSDEDKDGDGVANDEDAFPEDQSESEDLDGDGVGNNSDNDIDGDQVTNDLDAFPEDASESLDTDGDGIGDNADADKDGNNIDDAIDGFQQQIFQLPPQVTGLSDVVYHPGRNVFFIALKSNKSVVVVDADSGEIKQTRNFGYLSESLALSHDQSQLYVTLLSQEHVGYLPNGAEQEGRVAILNVNTLQQDVLHTIDIDPFDITATKDNGFIVSPGSSHSGSVMAFDAKTGLGTAGSRIDSGSYLSYSPTSNHFYTSDSFSNFEKFQLKDGTISFLGRNRYEAKGKVNNRVWVNPQGTKVITRGAALFDAETLTLERALHEGNATIENVSYSQDGKSVVLSMEGAIALTYNGDTMQQVGQNSLFGELKYSASNGNFTYHITELNNRYSIVKVFNPCAGCATNTAPKAELIVTPAQGDTGTEFVFDASASSDLENTAQLSFRWDFDSDGKWDTHFSSETHQTKRFVTPGTKYVRLQVKDNLGALTSVTKSVEVTQGSVAATPITEGTANLFELSADESLALANNKVLQIDKSQKRLYMIDLATGLAQHYYQFEYLPSLMHLDEAQQKLYVALDREIEVQDREANVPWSYIAVIDLTSNEWVKTFPQSLIIKDMVTDASGRLFILAYDNAGSKILELNTNDGSEVNRENAASDAKLFINHDKALIYALKMNLYTFYVVKYDISNDGLTTGTPHNVRHNTTDINEAWLTNDNQYFITNSGMVVSTETFEIISQLPLNQGIIKHLAYDDENNLIFLLDSNNKVHYFNQDTLLPIGQVTVPATTTQIYVVNNELVLLMSQPEGLLELVRKVHPCSACASNTVPIAQFSFTPEQGDTANEYQFDASASSDAEDMNLAYRWDVDSDGEFDTEFSVEAEYKHRFWIPGTYKVTLEVRDSGGMVAKSEQSLTVEQGEIAATPISNVSNFELEGLNLIDQVIDKRRQKIYLADNEHAKLSIYNTATNALESEFELPFSPGKMAMNVTGDKLYVILYELGSGETTNHEQRGYIASFDLDRLVWDQVFPIDINPSHIQASAQHVFVSSGFHHGNVVVAYSLETATEVARIPVRDSNVDIVFSSEDNQLYALNFTDIQKFKWSGRTFTEVNQNDDSRIKSQKQGWLAPDGKTLITKKGQVIATSDLTPLGYLKQSNYTISHAVFDPAANLVFTLSGNGNIEYFNLDSFAQVGELDHESRISWFAIHDEKVIVIAGDTDHSVVDSFTYPCMACLNNTAPTAKLVVESRDLVTGSPVDFDASQSRDPDLLNTLQYRWDFNGDGEWDTEFSLEASASYIYTLEGSKKVTVQVKDVTGTVAEDSLLLNVTQGVSSGTEITSSTPYELEATANDFYFDKSRNKAYLTDYSKKTLYVVDMTTGLAERYFSFEYRPSAIAVTPNGNRMYVALQTEDANQCCVWTEDQKGYVAVFNLGNTTWYDTFSVSIDPYDLVATDAGNVIISSGSGQWTEVQNYVASTGIKVGSAGIFHRSVLALHPEQDKVFAADRGLSPSDIEAFAISTSSITSLGDSPYHGDYKMWGEVWAMPDGDRVITRGGDIFAATDMTYQDSLLEDHKRINSVWFDTNTITVGYDDAKGVEQFSLTDLTSTGANENADAEFVFVHQGQTYYLEQDGAKAKLKAVTLN